MGINQCSARLWEGYPVGNLLLSAKHISHKCDHISRLDFQTCDNISHCFVCLAFEGEEDGDEIHMYAFLLLLLMMMVVKMVLTMISLMRSLTRPIFQLSRAESPVVGKVERVDR